MERDRRALHRRGGGHRMRAAERCRVRAAAALAVFVSVALQRILKNATSAGIGDEAADRDWRPRVRPSRRTRAGGRNPPRRVAGRRRPGAGECRLTCAPIDNQRAALTLAPPGSFDVSMSTYFQVL